MRGDVQYVNGEMRCFHSLLFVQKRFAEFIHQISDHVINPEARKVMILNREAVASILTLGVNDRGDWLLSDNFWHYFTNACSPHLLPYAANFTHTLCPNVHDAVSFLMRYTPFDPKVHRAYDLASFEVLLLFCTNSKNQAKLAQYIPLVKLYPTQVTFAIRKGLLRSDTRIGPLIFPLCALEY